MLIQHLGEWALSFLLTEPFSPDPQSVIAMGSPSNASLIRNFSDRQEMDSAASAARTTLMALAVRGARRGFTGRERETAAYPATVTPKVVGQKGEEGEGGREEREEERQAGQERAFSFLNNWESTRRWSFKEICFS